MSSLQTKKIEESSLRDDSSILVYRQAKDITSKVRLLEKLKTTNDLAMEVICHSDHSIWIRGLGSAGRRR
ncbi:TPA: hypothetical protein TUY05_001585 [Streptococcus equi subsp. zooepidemicus]|nr:hypothetical protein [Streptococcus equi subsp. zooepidemicus]HEL0726468.1 hypothetical protein [Streptococcus equi subsp. zooepidemicus]HEL1150319.1 hypothetical protein [Streptococcus equi subsp. zooepidemicus]